jgi:sigma-B regulation protein RsbU (phosphoserine phosphatase)
MTQIDRVLMGHRGKWQELLAFIVEMAREMSRQTDPQQMVQDYMRRVRQVSRLDGFVSLSRRGLDYPRVRVTRASIWGTQVNPWNQTDNLEIHEGGLFSTLIWGDEPVVLDDIDLPADDPAVPFVDGMRSATAIPLFDRGVAMNMIIALRKEPHAFDREELPERVWMANLFGRATHNLVLSEQLREAYDAIDREMKVVGDIQRSLLPATLPHIPGVELAVHYQTSRRAGGDYYDFFPLPGANGEPAGSPGGRWGILVADVSGHGTPAAVLMAVTHSIAHTHDGPPAPPSALMTFVNRHLAARYTNGNGTFVTAFYGIYDPRTREMTYTSAGHPPPRVRRTAGWIEGGFPEAGLPLGIDADECYTDGVSSFEPADLLVLYTDGVTEARGSDDGTDAGQEMFGTERLDAALARCPADPDAALAQLLQSVHRFTAGRPPVDDQTLLVASFR